MAYFPVLPSFPRGSFLPVHRDASEEKDGAVEVEVEEEADESAHEVPEHPVIPQHIAGNQEGQRQAVHQVGGGQVHHVDQGGVPATTAADATAAAAGAAAAGSQQHHRVEREAEEKGQRVADGQEDVLVGFVDAAGRRGQHARSVDMMARCSRQTHLWTDVGGLAQSHYKGRFWQSRLDLGSAPVISASLDSSLVSHRGLLHRLFL